VRVWLLVWFSSNSPISSSSSLLIVPLFFSSCYIRTTTNNSVLMILYVCFMQYDSLQWWLRLIQRNGEFAPRHNSISILIYFDVVTVVDETVRQKNTLLLHVDPVFSI
jgi:hypothetical protein